VVYLASDYLTLNQICKGISAKKKMSYIHIMQEKAIPFCGCKNVSVSDKNVLST
jgi:hypothetical protein